MKHGNTPSGVKPSRALRRGKGAWKRGAREAQANTAPISQNRDFPGLTPSHRDCSPGPVSGRVPMSLDASRAGPANPVNSGASSATCGRFLLPAAFMAAGAGTPSGVPVPESGFADPVSVRHPISRQTDRGGYFPNSGVPK